MQAQKHASSSIQPSLPLQLSDPDAVEPDAGDASEGEAGDLPTGASRGSSEESETSALGL